MIHPENDTSLKLWETREDTKCEEMQHAQYIYTLNI